MANRIRDFQNKKRRLVNLASWVTILMINASGCVYGPKSERKTTLSYLNGENYETAAGIGPDLAIAPIAKRAERLTKVTGRVVVGAGISETPLKFTPIILTTRDQQLMKRTVTGEDGRFRFDERLKNGLYVLRITNSKFTGEISFEVNSYEINGLILRVQPQTRPQP